METMNIAILKNTKAYDDMQEVDYIVCEAREITDGYLHDTYNGYGIQLDGYDAADYSLENSESSMASAVEIAITKQFERKLRQMADAESIDYEQWCDEAISVGSDGEVTVNGEIDEELSAFAKEYDEENAIYTEAKYINYWDGYNHQTLLISSQIHENDAWIEIGENDAEYASIIAALEKVDTYINEGYYKTEEIDGYAITISRLMKDHFITITRN